MSDSKTKRDLERFIRQQLFRVRETPLERFVLRSAAPGGKGAEVDTIVIPDGFNGDHIGILLDDICAKAQSDADSLGTKLQRYILIACEVGKKDGPRQAFRLRGEGDDDDGDEGEEAPTEKGLVSQLMRHNEALMRGVMMLSATQTTAMSRRLEGQEATINRMFDERVKDREAIEAAKSLSHERDMQMLLTSGQEDRKAQLVEKVQTLFPLIVNKLAGKEIIPDGADGDIVQKLAASFTQEQLQQMAPLLNNEQQLLMMTLIKAAREKAQKEESS